MKLLTVGQICSMHETLIARDGKLPGMRKGASVDSVVGRIEQYVYYAIDTPTAEIAAAVTTYALGVAHVFNDANKRTAAAAGIMVLKANGCAAPKGGDVQEMVFAAARSELDVDQFVVAYGARLL